MAEGPDATATEYYGGLPLAIVLQCPRDGAPQEEWNSHVQAAREALCNGRVVVVRNVREPGAGYVWDENSLALTMNARPDGRPVEWHCTFLLHFMERLMVMFLLPASKNNYAGSLKSSEEGSGEFTFQLLFVSASRLPS